MLADEQFRSLKPSVDELKRILDAFTIAVSNAVNGGTILTKEKNRKMADLVNQLEKVAIQLDVLAENNEDMVLAAGFELRKPNKPVSELVAPTGLVVTQMERSGSVKLSWNSTPGAVTYGIERLIAGETTWQNGDYSTSKNAVISGLKPGTFMTFHLRAIGTKGMKSEWSQEVSVWVA